jgi:superfamily II DNA or RNA helicase
VNFEGLLSLLDPRADRRGREFERICAWYLRNAPEYRVEVKQVWLWNEWPGRWAADAGIDLVVETFSGDHWAIQAKAYDPAYAIKKADIDSFLSESAREQFAYRLLIATTDHLGPTAQRTLAAQQKPAGLLLRSQLAVAEVEWPRSPKALAPPRPKRKRPRPHQRKAINAVVRGFRTAKRGQLIMACGTGKTLAACFLAEKLAARRVLVLVPSLSLLSQTMREWATASEFRYLAVCSDETVTGTDNDAVVASTSELGFPVTTDPAVIGGFLRRRGAEMRVVFATYQSSPRIAEAQADRTPAFDLVIADEAHRCAGPESGVFATVLNPAKIKASKRLFMTATPRFFTGRIQKEAEEAEWEIASMDDETRFGPVLHRLSFAEAIEQGLLSDYQVAVVGVSDATYREYAERGVFVTANGETVTDARTLASQLGLLRAMANYDLHRVVTFHSRIRSASAFARSLPEVSGWLPSDRRPDGSLWAEHVSGEMTSGERDSRLNRLRAVAGAQRGVLSNARCLAEGVDVPTLDGVAFIEPRRSQVDVVQAVGRAIRKADDKDLGTVVIPVFVDEGADPQQALESGEFDRVWQVVKALRAHDEVLAEELDQLRRELGRRGADAGRPGKIYFDLPMGVDERFARAFDTRLVERTTSRWEEGFSYLESFAAREGHTRVNMAHVEDGFSLGRWVREQRNARKKYPRRVSAERIARLEELPGWSWESWPELDWEKHFSNLQQYAEREGHSRVPPSHIENGQRLGLWVLGQRADYKKRLPRLTPQRASRLESLPGWTWGELRKPSIGWDGYFGLLQCFVEREGHARVPAPHLEDGHQLGEWVSRQRREYASGAKPMTVERTRRLEALPGWLWTGRDLRDWDEYYGLLERFAAREGHTRVAGPHVEDGRDLGKWVSSQRASYRSGARQLTAERVARLEALRGWLWSTKGDAWERGFSRLRDYVEREGDARVPTQYLDGDGYKLGQWLSKQRTDYAHGVSSMTADRVARLEALPGWLWSSYEDAWQKGYLRLLAFVEQAGHANVPRNHLDDDGYKLGEWVSIQRRANRAGTLEEQRASRLTALPGWLWDASAYRATRAERRGTGSRGETPRHEVLNQGGRAT